MRSRQRHRSKRTITSRQQTSEQQHAPLSASALKDLVAAALEALKALNTVCLDVRGLSDMTDYLVICSGASKRHVKSLANNVTQKARAAGHRPLGVEGEDAGEWVLVDLGDVLVHVMLPAARDFYDLERLWSSPRQDGADRGENGRHGTGHDGTGHDGNEKADADPQSTPRLHS